MEKFEPLRWTPELVKRFWDYESQFPENYFTYQYGSTILRRIRSHLPENGVICDYGCGMGFMIQHLLRAGKKTAGVDFSPESVQKVNRAFAGRDQFQGCFSPQEVFSRKEKFSAVLVLELVEHLYDPDLDELFLNLKRILTPGGRVLISTPNNERLEDSQVLCPVSGKVFHRWQHVRSWTEKTLTEFVERKGYVVRNSFTTDFTLDYKEKKIPFFKGSIRNFLKPKEKPHLVLVAEHPERAENG